MFLLLLFISSVQSEELPTPSSLLRPRNFNHHALQYLREVSPEPTKQGPIQFPNDAPPPPRPPLVVTSRPLSESIARSDLGVELNNSIAEQSQRDEDYVRPSFRLKPEYFKNTFRKPEFRLKPEFQKQRFLARVKDYKPFAFSNPQPAVPLEIDPYAGVLQKARLSLPAGTKDHRFSDYEVKDAKNPHRYQHNDVGDESDYDHESNYAFSYRVKDKETGDDFSHSQHSTGSATNGEYRVRLPDGRMQIVSYTADENGYKADVRYDDDDKTSGNSIDHDKNYDYKHATQNYKHVTPDYKQVTQNYKHVTPNYEHVTPDYKQVTQNYKQVTQNYKHATPNYEHVTPNYEHFTQNYKHVTPNYEHVTPSYKHVTNDYNPVTPDYEHILQDYKQVPNYNQIAHAAYTTAKSKYDYDSANLNVGNLGNSYNNYDYTKNAYDYNADNKYKHIEEENKKEVKPVKEDYDPYSDLSKEYDNDDYSVEYEGKNNDYNPHKSKFAQFSPKSDLGGAIVVANQQDVVSSSTVRPSYEELKPLFVTKNLYAPNPTEGIFNNVEINVPSTTPSSFNFDQTTEHVVIIGRTKPNFYTNIRNVPLTATPPVAVTTVDSVTPRSYLVSTIANLKNGQRPVLSDSFINRINKYLTFT